MAQVFIFLSIVGATGLFLYGMKLMGESVQKILGEKLRMMLSSMSSNRLWGVLSGIFITALIQSSSATTVMVVSFVNAGVIRLIDAIAVIMGANVGNTLTAWIISLVGFQFDLSYFSLPLIGVSLPFLFSTNRKWRIWGELILGFSLLIISMRFLWQSVPGVHDSSIKTFITTITSWGVLTYMTFFLAGALFTILVKSSNAILALTIVFSIQGWIGFEHAVLMVLGESLGTTISAINASKKASGTAKRAALAHFFFNLFGVIWALLLFPFFIKFIVWGFQSIGGKDPFTHKEAIPISIALFHTMFKLMNMFLLLPFANLIKNLVTRVVPTVTTGENDFKFSHIKIGLLSTPEASLYQAKMETMVFAERIRKMFRNLERLMALREEKDYQELKEKLLAEETFADRMEHEIAGYLTKVAEGRLSESNSFRLRALFKMIDDIESIADSCINILNAINRQRENRFVFPESIKNNILLMINMVNDALDFMVTVLTHSEELPLSMAQNIEQEINNFRDILKSEHINNLANGLYSYDEGIIYNDIISQCERIGDYSINVVEASKNQF